MNHYLLALLLGIIEGVTEFLPISSTAHLRIAQGLVGVNLEDDYWKMFSVVIQLGAILSVVVYFWKRIVGFARTYPRGREGNRTWWNHPLALVVIAFLCTAGPSYLLAKVIHGNLESLAIMGWALVAGGVVMWVVDALFTRPRVQHMDNMGLLDAVWIGIVQNLAAVFPGASRSMSTIVAGQTFGLSRTAALEFSFFVSIPTMFAACGYELFKFVREGAGGDAAAAAVSATQAVSGGIGAPVGFERWTVLAVGFVVSFLVAWAVVAWFMHWVQKRGFVPFAVYRLVLGVLVLGWVYGPLEGVWRRVMGGGLEAWVLGLES